MEGADEETEDRAASEVSAAEHVGVLREEVAELRRLASVADRAIAGGEERSSGRCAAALDRALLVQTERTRRGERL